MENLIVKVPQSNLLNPFIETELDIHRILTSKSSYEPLIDIYGDFNKRQMRFILYIMLEVEGDVINLNTNYLRRRFKVCSAATISKDVSSLEAIGLIRKKCSGQYWINPFIFFKGDLSRFYKDKLKSIVMQNFPKLYITHYTEPKIEINEEENNNN